MYRALTLHALDLDVDVEDEAAVDALVETVEIDVRPPTAREDDGRTSTVLVNDRDVTWEIRTPRVDQNVSTVSAYGKVRLALSHQQRRIGNRYSSGQAEKPGIVMAGRDIGTVVLPDAELKIYMDATAEERAQRRFREQNGRDGNADYEQILADIVHRDRVDSERHFSPLRPAEDAIVIDTSNTAPEDVVARIMALAGTARSTDLEV